MLHGLLEAFNLFIKARGVILYKQSLFQIKTDEKKWFVFYSWLQVSLGCDEGLRQKVWQKKIAVILQSVKNNNYILGCLQFF